MADLYLNPGLATGANDGSTPENAYQSWAACAADVNANHADRVAAADPLRILLIGTVQPFTTTVTFTVRSSEAYPLIFETPEELRSPGVFDFAAPGINIQAETAILITVPPGETTAGVQLIGLQMTGPFRQGFKVTVPQGGVGPHITIKNCYFKDRYNGTTQDFAAVMNVGVDYVPGTLISHNNIFENFISTYLPVEDRYAKCQPYRWPAGAGLTIRMANDTYINVDVQVMQANLGSDWSVINCILKDTPKVGNFAIASISGYNISNNTEAWHPLAEPLPGSVGNAYEVDVDALFVSATNRNMVAANDYGIGPSNADTTRAALVPQFDANGVERTGTVTDVGAFLYSADATIIGAISPLMTGVQGTITGTGFGT